MKMNRSSDVTIKLSQHPVGHQTKWYWDHGFDNKPLKLSSKQTQYISIKMHITQLLADKAVAGITVKIYQ